MSHLHRATNHPGNRGRLILRLLLDGNPPEKRSSVETADTRPAALTAVPATTIAIDAPKLNAASAARPNFLGRPRSLPTQN